MRLYISSYFVTLFCWGVLFVFQTIHFTYPSLSTNSNETSAQQAVECDTILPGLANNIFQKCQTDSNSSECKQAKEALALACNACSRATASQLDAYLNHCVATQ